MYIGVHKPSSSNGGNKGSSSDLTDYLSKEDKSKLDYITDDNLAEFKNFYDKDNNELNVFEATELIDKHSKGLEKSDTKFYMITINPSDKELDHLKNISEKEAKNTNQNSDEVFNKNLMNYTRLVMDEYAKNFGRELNGKPLNVDDLNYVARIENERTYKYNDPKVIHNKEVSKTNEGEYLRNSKNEIIKEGMKKDGNNEHIHVIVSRYDASKSLKLSPHAIAKTSNDNHIVNGQNVTIGFNHIDFKVNSEKAFDKAFDYDRSKDNSTSNSIQNAQANKNSLTDMLSKGNSIINNNGQVDTVNLAVTVAEVAVYAVANPVKAVEKIVDAGKEQFKAVALPDVDSNPIKEAQQKLDLKQQAKEKIKSTITSGGLDKD